MSEYTEGPWELTEHEDREGGNPWYRITGESTLFLEVVECSDGYVPGQNKANAHLIAAAPELLAMLLRVRETCHLSEDEELGDDIDRLVGKALGQPHYKELNDLLDDLDDQEDEEEDAN